MTTESELDSSPVTQLAPFPFLAPNSRAPEDQSRTEPRASHLRPPPHIPPTPSKSIRLGLKSPLASGLRWPVSLAPVPIALPPACAARRLQSRQDIPSTELDEVAW